MDACMWSNYWSSVCIRKWPTVCCNTVYVKMVHVACDGMECHYQALELYRPAGKLYWLCRGTISTGIVSEWGKATARSNLLEKKKGFIVKILIFWIGKILHYSRALAILCWNHSPQQISAGFLTSLWRRM